MKSIVISIAAFVTIFGGFYGAAEYDRQDVTKTYRVADMFGGGRGVIETTKGNRIGIYSKETTVGLFEYGSPRVVGFHCDGTDEVLIAMEESDLPRCDRIEPIIYQRKATWAD